jgi:RNA polymerase sigma factor (TIGR02999 family)
LVYDELRKLAAQKLAQEKPGQTLQATALVHDAYLKLVGPQPQPAWQGRSHFYAAAAEAMRRILLDNARRKRRVRHGGQHRQVPLVEAELVGEVPADDFVALDEALARLAVVDATKAELVKLRFFAGLSLDESAELLNISRATAARYWAFARAWLFDALSRDNQRG